RVGGAADERDLRLDLLVGQLLRQHGRRVADFKLGGGGVRDRGLDDHFAVVGDVEQFRAGGGILALVLELVGDDAGEWRADRRVTQLRVERRQAVLRLLNARRGGGAVVGIARRLVQPRGGFGGAQVVLGG